MKKRQVAMMVLVVGALTAVAAVAAGQRLNYRQHSWTGTSGFSGTILSVLLVPHPETNRAGDDIQFGRGMTGITLFRSGIFPMGVSVGYRYIGKRANQSGLRSHALWHTTAATPRRDIRDATGNLTVQQVRALGDDQYVTGISVCTSQTGTTANDTVQGIRLFLSTHTGGTNLERVGTAEVVQSSDCQRWHDRQNCPRGTIGSGVRFYHNGLNIRGMALRCTALN